MSPTRSSREGRHELEGELERLEAERSQTAERIRLARSPVNRLADRPGPVGSDVWVTRWSPRPRMGPST